MKNRILIATDAWNPQVNGVVTTLNKINELNPKDNIWFITPDDFKNYSNCFYPEIRLAFPTQTQISKLMCEIQPKYIHISTEGPIGYAVRKWCIRNNVKFTTSYHTKFPEFLKAFYNIPTWITYPYFKMFHNAGCGMFVATKSLAKELEGRGFKNLIPWSRGVDLKLFKPSKKFKITQTKMLLYVGRVSKEKNIDAFLDIYIKEPHIKVVVGDGPDLERLKKKYVDVDFVGKITGEKLAKYYQMADCFVFPSKVDTFGIVIIEALACGTPVAAYPVTGPIDILNDKVGAMDEDLSEAVKIALKLNRNDCAKHAKKYNWKNVVDEFIYNIINR